MHRLTPQAVFGSSFAYRHSPVILLAASGFALHEEIWARFKAEILSICLKPVIIRPCHKNLDLKTTAAEMKMRAYALLANPGSAITKDTRQTVIANRW